jgi:predicted ester cyclase
MRTMSTGIDLANLLRLWEVLPSRRADAYADFSALYADPVLINDRPTSVADLIVRAEALNTAFSDSTTELLEVVEEGERLAFAFHRTAIHTGTWSTPLGDLGATGARVTLTGMDILTVEGGKVVAIRVLSDDVTVLFQAAGSRIEGGSAR